MNEFVLNDMPFYEGNKVPGPLGEKIDNSNQLIATKAYPYILSTRSGPLPCDVKDNYYAKLSLLKKGLTYGSHVLRKGELL